MSCRCKICEAHFDEMRKKYPKKVVFHRPELDKDGKPILRDPKWVEYRRQVEENDRIVTEERAKGKWVTMKSTRKSAIES